MKEYFAFPLNISILAILISFQIIFSIENSYEGLRKEINDKYIQNKGPVSAEEFKKYLKSSEQIRTMIERGKNGTATDNLKVVEMVKKVSNDFKQIEQKFSFANKSLLIDRTIFSVFSLASCVASVRLLYIGSRIYGLGGCMFIILFGTSAVIYNAESTVIQAHLKELHTMRIEWENQFKKAKNPK